MTNTEIIADEIKMHGLMTDVEVAKFYATNGFMPLNTFAEWKRLGYIVKRGEHATITSKLWRYTDRKSKKAESQKTAMDKAEDEQESGRYYLAKAFLFTSEQVQKLA